VGIPARLRPAGIFLLPSAWRNPVGSVQSAQFLLGCLGPTCLCVPTERVSMSIGRRSIEGISIRRFLVDGEVSGGDVQESLLSEPVAPHAVEEPAGR